MPTTQTTCCYFPTTALFIDDRKNFLENLTLNLSETLSYRTFTDPNAAIQFLNESSQADQLFKKWLLNLEEQELIEIDEPHAHSLVDLDISAIYKILYSPERFREVTVAVVDYAMPKMNGLDFCRALTSTPIKKLMMTGEASDHLAIDAFNERIIDKFIRKQSPTFYDDLHTAIEELQKHYFKDISRSVIEHLAISPDCWLLEPDFSNLFSRLVQENQIVEYYLIDQSGSFLMLDAKGKPYWLIVKSDRILKGFIHIAEDNEAPTSVQNVLKNKEKIPFFFTEKDLEVPVEAWGQGYLHPAKTIQGAKQLFHYAFIKGASVYDIQPDKIISYDYYLGLL
ncbi:MAG: hypothetical protein JW855_01495 [Gammaproteobacteria bacterium]|nr:hypothetical protein [Gammaproteobacteria bacterium]